MEIRVEDEQIIRKLSKLQNRTSNMTSVMRDSSIIMKNSVLHSFDTQSDGKRKWKDLSPGYKKYKQKKKGTAYPILVFHNRLKQSINTRHGKHFAQVYTGVKYGVVHQLGSKKKNIPARPFMVIHKNYKDIIIKRIREALKEASK
jgi:phage virion morphogenesis protein